MSSNLDIKTKPNAYYHLCQKVLDTRIPVATFSGGIHRLDLTVDEYAELKEILFGDGQSKDGGERG